MPTFHFNTLILTAFATLFLLSGCGESTTVGKDPAIGMGEQIFLENCSTCHPRTGRGDYLKKIPATRLIMKSPEELKTWIRGIGMHREMPSFENLTEEELTALTVFLHNEKNP